MCFENDPPTDEATAAAGEPASDKKEVVSQMGRGTKQHCRQILGKNSGSLPAHISQLFEDADKDSRGKTKAQNEIIDHLFEKNNDGKWEMVLNAPFFEQAKVRCYIYRDGT